ncbi:MAG TPA: lipid II flippase MurJ, partial [Opitutaceae bacterium]|nr:lipid II flippase MurJ [Opitutaceae bacterium]
LMRALFARGAFNLTAADTSAAASPILLNIAIVGALLASRYFPSREAPAYGAAYGVFVAGILELIFMVWVGSQAGIRLHLRLPRWGQDVKAFLTALGNATVGAGSVQIGLFIDTLIASFLPSGDLTALYYADRINQLPMGIIGVALGTVLLPEMSAKIAAHDEKGATVAQNRAVVLGLLLTLPCIAAFFIIPDTLMRALFARGAFNLTAADTSAAALVAYGVGLPAFVLLRCVTPSFYARGDTATPVRATIVSVLANVAVKFALVWGAGFGVVGLALGTSLGAWVNFAVLAFLARRRAVLVATPELKRAIVPVIAAAAAAAAGFFAGVSLGRTIIGPGAFHDMALFLMAGVAGATGYVLTVLAFRRSLPFPGARS